MSLGNVLSWAVNNYGNLLGLLAVVVASASILIKALEAVVKLLVTVFPKLKGADGGLVKAAAWLDALSKASWLNTLAASPKSKQ